MNSIERGCPCVRTVRSGRESKKGERDGQRERERERSFIDKQEVTEGR